MVNDFLSFLLEGVIFGFQVSESCKQILNVLVKVIGEKIGVDSCDIFDVVIECENFGLISVGEGVVILYVCILFLSKFVGVFVKLEEGVDFDVIDGCFCDLIFMLLVLNVFGVDYLWVLVQVSWIFCNVDLCDVLCQVQDLDSIECLFCLQIVDVIV